MKLAKVTITEIGHEMPGVTVDSISSFSLRSAPVYKPLMSFMCTYKDLTEKLSTALSGILQSRGSKSFTVTLVEETVPDEYIAEEYRA